MKCLSSVLFVGQEWTVEVMNDDEILALNVDELIKRFKELGCWTYRSSDPDKVIVVSMIAQAVEKIAYAKGVKRGKSIGSHAAYSHFLKHGRWILDENEKNPRYQIKTCSLCGCRVNGTQFNFCPHCGAKMDGKQNVPRD